MNTRIILLCFICVFYFSSCSIEKRHYTKGFYVEWLNGKHSLPLKQNQSQKQQNIDTNQIISASISPDINKEIAENSSTLFLSKKSVQQSQFSETQPDTPIHPIQIKQYDPQTKSYVNSGYTGKVMNGWALAGFLAIASCLILPWISVYSLIVLLPFSVIASVVGLIQIYSNPIKYKGQTLALISLVLASLTILLIIFAIKNLGQ